MKSRMAVAFMLFFVSALFSQGRIIPRLPDRTADVELQSSDVSVIIQDGVADVTLDQVVYNKGATAVEADYVLLLPGETQIYDFYLEIDGKKVKGELLQGENARQIYEDIVRRLRDPALLEYAGHGLFRARIFPVQSKKERRIRVRYAEVLESQSGNYRFRIPLGEGSGNGWKKTHIQVAVQESRGLGNIYSPSHELEFLEKSEHKVRLTAESGEGRLTGDFRLFYSIPVRGLNYSLLSFRPRTDRDGYFLLQASIPEPEMQKHRISRNVIFVIDVSGSMQGQKIDQAQKALRSCITALDRNDYFEIVSFSSTVRSFQGKFTRAGRDSKENAFYFIDNLSSSGGTNINAALQVALSLTVPEGEGVKDIIFLTDGLPTEGETDIRAILDNVKKNSSSQVRIFSFGVGWDVNTFLLDKISLENRGSVEYVKPGENIESSISFLFSKITGPVFTDIEINFGDAGVYDFYPQRISDLFKGERLTLFGRYSGNGEYSLTIKGRIEDRSVAYKIPVTFNRRETENVFIAKLWANRKVSSQLDEIRFRGETPELVESVKALGMEYGIVTPYTAYLVREQQEELTALDERDGITGRRLLQKQESLRNNAAGEAEIIGSEEFYEALIMAAPSAEAASGKSAVTSSQVMKKVRKNEKDVDMLLTVKKVGERTFRLKNAVWTESHPAVTAEPDRTIEFLSDEYFDFLRQNPAAKDVLALGENILFIWNNQLIRIHQ